MMAQLIKVRDYPAQVGLLGVKVHAVREYTYLLRDGTHQVKSETLCNFVVGAKTWERKGGGDWHPVFIELPEGTPYSCKRCLRDMATVTVPLGNPPPLPR